jgi:cytochrome c peroxidase
VPDPSLTTRERFSVHSTDPSCANCHAAIDSFGNAFEQFDGMGEFRLTENTQPVDSSTTVAVGADFDGDYADSNELALALAASPTVHECFARHAFRAAAGRSGESMVESEQYFIDQWKHLSGDPAGNLKQILKTYVESALFTHRRAQ